LVAIGRLKWALCDILCGCPRGRPSGVVTFLFTDIEGSTRRWEADAHAMQAALLVHDEVLRDAIETHEGFLLSHR
jgi:class 3 adenylate cyclase